MQDQKPVVRVLRGGAWHNHAANARAAYRNHDQRGNARHNNGFRLALSSAALPYPWALALRRRGAAGWRPGAAAPGTRQRVLPTVACAARWQTARAPGCW